MAAGQHGENGPGRGRLAPRAAEPDDRPSTSQFETVLDSMFAASLSDGESFVDVTARALTAAVNGPGKSSRGLRVCCNLMRRKMIPGDHELSATHGTAQPGLLIRFRLPR